MVKLLTTEHISGLVKKIGIRKVMTDIEEYLTEDFKRWNDFDKVSRVATHYYNGVIELMPISTADTYAFKYVNGHPKNTELGKQTVAAAGMLADAHTGYPYLFSEMTYLTAIRTAAVSALAARHMAREDSRVLTLIGTGAQAEFQTLALTNIFEFDEIRFFDVDPRAMEKFIDNMSNNKYKLTPCLSNEEAIKGADLVTTATAVKENQIVLTADDVDPGMHINAVGGDCPGKTELSKDILLQSHIVVDYEPQTRIEGEIQQLSADDPVNELWKVVAGHCPGRKSAADITLFDSVGFALEDYSILRYFNDRALEEGSGESIQLIPELPDPKNIYGSLMNISN